MLIKRDMTRITPRYDLQSWLDIARVVSIIYNIQVSNPTQNEDVWLGNFRRLVSKNNNNNNFLIECLFHMQRC